MGGKLTSALSQETRDLLRDNKSFFEAVTNLGDKTGIKIQGKDAEARTEVEVQADGNVAVSFVYPVDDNGQTDDGRIYLRDTFTWDPSQKKLNGYKRDFQYNGRGEDKEGWQKRLAAYRTSALPDDQKLQAFAMLVARTFSRPFSAEHVAIFGKNKGETQQFGTLIAATQAEGLALRVKDPRSHYAVFHRGLTTEVVFSYVAEDPEGRKSGHLLIQDKFSFNGNTGEWVGYERTAKVGTGSSDNEYWEEKARKIAAAAKPDAATAKAFILNFMPDLLTKIPQPANAPAEPAPPPGGYAEYSDALFRKTMSSVVRSAKAVPLAQMEPQFFKGLAAAEKYFEPLKASLGADFPLNLKDPPVEVTTSVEGGKTFVFMKFSFRPQGGEGQGYLDYTERWTFENGQPAKVDRRAQAFGAPEGGSVELAAKRINEDIAAEKYPPIADKGTGQFDERTLKLLSGTIPFVAPHVAYFGMPRMLDNPQLGYEQRMVFEVLDAAKTSLEPLLHLQGIDPAYRTRVLRMLAGMGHGDLETAGAAMQELEQTEDAALKAATTPEEKHRHEDNLRLTRTVFALSSGDMDKAQELVKGFHSPAFKRAFEKPLAPFFARRRAMEGLAVMAKVAEDQISLRVRDSKAWSYKGPKVDPEAEKKVIDGLFQKAFLQTTQSKKSDAIEVLRELSEIGKGKKPEEYNEVEKHLALTAEERVLAERVIQDTLMVELAAIAQDDMKDIQAQRYMGIARAKLFDKGMVGSARWLTQMVATDKLPKSRAAESLDILKTMASEKIELAYPALKQAPDQVHVPQEYQALEPLLTKVAEKSVADTKKSVLTLLQEMTDLQGDELKLRDTLLKSPSLKKVDEAAKLPTVAERVKVYRSIFEGVLKGDPKDPKFAQVKAMVDEQMSMIEKASEDGAPGPEGVLLAPLMAQLDLATAHDSKAQDVAKAAEAHDKDIKAAQSLLDKASLAAVQKPGETAFAVLRAIPDAELNEDEKRIRAQLLEDKTLEKFTGVAAEASMEKRVETYTQLLQDPEFAKTGFKNSAVWLAQMLQSGKIPDLTGYHPPLVEGQPKPVSQENAERLERDVQKFLALTEGKGDFGSKFEVGLKHFTKEVSKPTTLAAMTLAPFAGAGCEMIGLWKFRNWGIIGRGIGWSAGVAGEAAAFTYSSKALDSYFYTSEGVWENHKGDLKSNILLFGAMRGAHATSAALSERFLATGPRGFKWAGGYVAGDASAAGLAKSPTGRLLNVGKAAGPGVPQLTVNGRRLATVLDHGFAVGSMYAAGKANYKLGWSKHDGTFSDTLLMYVQAMAGFRLANSLTGGKLQLGMMVSRMRIENLKGRSEIFELQGKIDAAKKDGKTSKELIEALEKELQRLQEAEQKAADEAPAAKPAPEGMLKLFDARPKDLSLTKVEGGEKLEVALPKEGQKSSLDAFLPLGEGQSLRLSREKGGSLVLHHEATAEPKSEAKAELKPEGKAELKPEAKAEPKPEAKAGEKPADPAGTPPAQPNAEAKGSVAPSVPPAPVEPVLLNGEPVAPGKSVKVFHGDVLSVRGKEVRIDVTDPLVKELAATPREHQMSLARAIAKAKDPAALFKMLRESPYQGGAEVFVAVAEVFSGRRPLDSLPVEMGIQAKVKSLLEAQVAELKKAGLGLDPATQLKGGVIDPRLSPLEVEFQTLKAMEALKLRVGRARTLAEALETLGESPFKKIGGVTTKEIFDWLGHEQLKAVVEQAKKSEGALLEKIGIAEKRLKLEEGKKRQDKSVITELKEKLEEWKAGAEKSKELYTALEKALEEHQKDLQQANVETDPAKLVEKLPADFGIRQKGRDAVEQANGKFEKSLSDKEIKTAISLVKKYLDVQAKEDFPAAQNTLRHALDNATPQARVLLRRASEAEMEVLLKVYFGEAAARELPAAQAYQTATLLGHSRAKQELGILQDLNNPRENVELVRGDLDALSKQVDGKALVFRSHPSNKDGQQLVFTKNEILGLAEQAKQIFAGQESKGGGDPYRGAPDNAYQGQHSDTQAFFDPATRSFQTWVVHPKGLSRVKITLDVKGEVEKFEIKYAAKPEASGKGQASLLTPPKLEELKGEGGAVIPVDGVRVEYDALLKEFPFDVPGVTRAERAFDAVAKVTDRIPSLPSLPKFRKEAKSDAKTEGKDPKDPPADGAAPADKAAKPAGKPGKKSGKKGRAAKKSDADASLAGGLRSLLRGDKSNPVIAFFSGALELFTGSRAKAPKDAKPDSKTEDASIIAPAAPPPKLEGGSRPTLPEGLKIPDAKLAMGELGGFEKPESLEIHYPANAVMGEAYAKTHEGAGRAENQDGVAATYTPARDLVIAAADGMGGHVGGKEAARILLENFIQQVSQGQEIHEASQLANKKIMAEYYKPEAGKKSHPGAGIVVLKVNRPEVHGAPHTMEAFWGSDLQLTLFRAAPDGHGSWIYSTLPQNWGRMSVDMAKDYGPMGAGRDLNGNAHRLGANVENPAGTPKFRLLETAAGEVFDPQTGFRPAEGLNKIALKDGDVAIAGSDGLWKNIPDRNLAYEWTKDAKTAKEKAQILDAKVRERMKIAEEADAKFESGELSKENDRMSFQFEGKELFIDYQGNVYDQAKGGKLVDHFEADNFSVFVYVHDTKAPDAARVDSTPPAPKPEPEAGLGREPSDKELSDPDKTGVWKRPESLKEKPEDKPADLPAPDPDNEVTVVAPMPKAPKSNPNP